MDLKKKFESAVSPKKAADRPVQRHRSRLVVFTSNSPAHWFCSAATALLASMCVSALAQQPPRPDAGSILEGTKPPVVLPRPTPDVLPRPAEPRPALGAPGLKVVVTRFRISGNTLFSEEVLTAAVREFVGKEQNIDGLNDAATKVRAYYRERGYFLAQAYLPQQEIKDGVVEIAVIEARLGKVELNLKEGSRFSEGIVRGIIEKHLKEGDLITETGLETPLLMLNDFPNAVVSSEIRPSKTIGAADIRINVADSPGLFNGNVSVDNAGNRFTGAIRYSLNVNVNNPLALGDQLSANAMHTDEPMGLYRLGYILPVGPWGTRLGFSYTTFHYQLGKEFSSLRARGVGSIVGVSVFHPLLRTRSANLILQAAYDDKSLNDRIGDSNEDRSIVASHLGVVGDLRDGLLGGGLNSFGLTVTEGNARIVNPPAALAADRAGRNTVGRFSKYNYEFRRLQKITDNASLLLAIQGQIGSRNLMSAEKFSLGGSTGIRAYPTGEALADSGYIFQGEFRYIVPGFKLASGDVTLSAFWDQGWARLNQNQLPTDAANERRLSGYGVGASVGKDSDFLLRASAAWRNENELPISDTASRIPRVWVQGIKWF